MTLLGDSKLLVCETGFKGDCGTEEREMRVGKLKLHKTHILTEIQSVSFDYILYRLQQTDL